MNQYYKESTKANLYKKVVDTVFNIDIHSKSRKRNVVNARMIFSKCMRDEGASYGTIARYLYLESHVSIMHYMKQLDHLLKYDKELISKHNQCVRYFAVADPKVDELLPHELKSRILVLEDKNKLLSLELAGLNYKIKASQEKDKRFSNLFDLIRQRTKPESEEVIEKKLNTIFNGIYN